MSADQSNNLLKVSLASLGGDPYLPLPASAVYLGVSKAFMYANADRIEHFKVNSGRFGKLLFRRSALDLFAETCFVKVVPNGGAARASKESA